MKNKRVRKLVAMLYTLDRLIRERIYCFCISRNLYTELEDSYSKKEQRGAERRYEDLVIITDKLITKIRTHIVENGGDALYEQAKEIFC